MALVFFSVIVVKNFKGNSLSETLNTRGWENLGSSTEIIVYLGMDAIGPLLLWITIVESHR